jgi:uncharacterized integral membrane protein
VTSSGSPVDPLRTPGTTGPAAPGPSSSPGSHPGPASGPAATGRTSPSTARSAGRTVGRTLALALLLFVTVVLVLFVIYNTQTVEVSLVFTNLDAPLVLALLIAAALGGLLVWLAGLVTRARRRGR